VLKTLGQEAADSIEWASSRLLCIAGNFTKFDGHAVQQINRNIELIRYLRFDEGFLLLELVNAVEATSLPEDNSDGETKTPKDRHKDKSVSGQIASASPELLDLYNESSSTCKGLGDDVQAETLKLYVAFKRLKIFVTVEVKATVGELLAVNVGEEVRRVAGRRNCAAPF